MFLKKVSLLIVKKKSEHGFRVNVKSFGRGGRHDTV